MDFSKMTIELYQSILNARTIINESKKGLALLLLEIENIQNNIEKKKLKKEVIDLIKNFSERDENLKQFEF
jgi:hypothetical protein